MTKTYLYDGEFDSLLALVYELIRLKIIPDDIKCNYNYSPSLLDNGIDLYIFNKMKKIDYLRKRISNKMLFIVYYVYLSRNNNKEIIIYNFIKNVIKYKDNVLNKKIDCVLDVIKIFESVSCDANKLKKSLKFSEIEEDILYAKYSSNNNVICILANYFKNKFNNKNFIIRDVNRGIYALYDKNKIIYLRDYEIGRINLDLNNKNKLFNIFFNKIVIKEKSSLNYKYMPKRYYNKIIEMGIEYNLIIMV